MAERLYSGGTMECPFCGSHTLYQTYHMIDGSRVPTMFCNWCKVIVTVEAIEDYADDPEEATKVLLDAWNGRPNGSMS